VYGYRSLSRQADMLSKPLQEAFNEDDLEERSHRMRQQNVPDGQAAAVVASLIVAAASVPPPQMTRSMSATMPVKKPSSRQATVELEEVELQKVEPEPLPPMHLRFEHHPGDELWYEEEAGHSEPCTVKRCERTQDGVHYVISRMSAEGIPETLSVPGSKLRAWNAPRAGSPGLSGLESARSISQSASEDRPAFAPIGGGNHSTRSTDFHSTRSQQRRSLRNIPAVSAAHAPLDTRSPSMTGYRPSNHSLIPSLRSGRREVDAALANASMSSMKGGSGISNASMGGVRTVGSANVLSSPKRPKRGSLTGGHKSPDPEHPGETASGPNSPGSFSKHARHTVRHHHHHSPAHRHHPPGRGSPEHDYPPSDGSSPRAPTGR